LISDHMQPARRNGAAIFALMPPRRTPHDKHTPCQTPVGLTRQSIKKTTLCEMDARVKPAHDG
jgi:hypothetical protein